MHIVPRTLDHPDVLALNDRLQAEYVRIYGYPDAAPTVPAQFIAPDGGFAVGYVDDQPIAMGGWRRRDDGPGEVKRIYVHDDHRARGYARAMLAWIEDDAARCGIDMLTLETNEAQPAAVRIYTSVGYTPVSPFGYYIDDPRSVYLGVGLPRIRDIA